MDDVTIIKKKILVVEDEAPLRNALRDMLELAGFIVLNAQDGHRPFQCRRF